MDIKLIAMDLDGTALGADRTCFSPRLNAALEEAHRRGISIAIVTGRQYGMLPPPVLCHPVWEDLVVLCNGGQIRRLSDGTLLHFLGIDPQALEALQRLSSRFDLALEFSTESILHLTQHSLDLQIPRPELAFHRDVILRHHGKIVDSLRELQNVEKAQLPYIPEELRQKVVDELRSIAVSAVWSSRSSMEITHPEATKGNALEALCRIKGICPANVMALGDSGNDESMLRLAGLGVAMGNAPPFIKDCADAVTLENTWDGAAVAIEQWALA